MKIVERVLAIGLLCCLFWSIGWAGYMVGVADMRRHTIVKVGSPYFLGVFHGECAQIVTGAETQVQACATDDIHNGL